jgi:trk system potassium uptake protein TrkH
MDSSRARDVPVPPLENPLASGKSDKIDSRADLPLQYASAAPGSGGEDVAAEFVRWLFPAYIFLILVGFFTLRAPGVMPAGNELNPDRAVFTSVNAATLTGFQLSIHPSEFFTAGKLILLALTVIGTLFTLIVGGLAVKRILRLSWPDRRIVVAAFVVEAFVLAIGALSAAGRYTVVGGMTQTAAAWGNSGLYVDAPPGPFDLFTYVVLLPLAVFGGFGLVVVLQIKDYLWHQTPLLRHTQVVLRMSALLFLVGFAGCALLRLLDLESAGMGKAESWFAAFRRLWPRVLVEASVTSLNVRTAGFNVLPLYSLKAPLLFFLLPLMMIGASPGGSGGGLKTTTVYELFMGPLRALRGEPVSRTFGIAATWLGLYLLALGAIQILLLWAEPQMPGDRVLFVTISALSNVGLSHDVLSMTRSSLLLVSAAMFFGRVTPLLILWWMVDTTRDADVAVG